MRKAGIFALTWLGLFGATIGIRTAVAALQGESSSDQPVEDTELDRRFEAMPTKSAMLSTPDGEVLSKRIQEYMFANDAGIRHCRTLLTKHPTPNRVIFQVSFVPSLVGTKIHLQRAVLEKSTIELTAEEKRCIEDEIAGIEIPREGLTVPLQRVPVSFCFGGLSSSAEY